MHFPRDESRESAEFDEVKKPGSQFTHLLYHAYRVLKLKQEANVMKLAREQSAPPVFAPMFGSKGLVEGNKEWLNILDETRVGAECTITALSPLRLRTFTEQANFTDHFRVTGQVSTFKEPVTGLLVCVESMPTDTDSGQLRKVISVNPDTYLLPPFTKLRVVKRQDDCRGYLHHPDTDVPAKHKLIVVTPSYSSNSTELAKIIGPADSSEDDGWKSELLEAARAGFKVSSREGADSCSSPPGKTAERDCYLHDLEAWTQKHESGINGMGKMRAHTGFNNDDALLAHAMQHTAVCAAIQESLSAAMKSNAASSPAEVERSPPRAKYRNLIHKGFGLLSTYAKEVREGKSASAVGHVPRKCYAHLTGKKSLSEQDPLWRQIEVADRDGFRGFTSVQPIVLRIPSEERWSEKGLMARKKDGKVTEKVVDGKVTKLHEMEVVDSDVVCFESAAQDDHLGLHAVVKYCGDSCILPPMTLLNVTRVEEEGFEYMKGMRITRKCIYVRPTYLPTTQGNTSGLAPARLCGDRVFLEYGDSHDVQHGMDDVINDPVLTMEQEFMRDDTWTDWKEDVYCAADEYRYVAHEESEDGRRGNPKRDRGQGGKLVGYFLSETNEVIRNLCLHGTGKPPHFSELLTTNEMIGLRLYTGPAYQPVNEFCRDVWKVSKNTQL
jgi:hypothetical protein